MAEYGIGAYAGKRASQYIASAAGQKAILGLGGRVMPRRAAAGLASAAQKPSSQFLAKHYVAQQTKSVIPLSGKSKDTSDKTIYTPGAAADHHVVSVHRTQGTTPGVRPGQPGRISAAGVPAGLDGSPAGHTWWPHSGPSGRWRWWRRSGRLEPLRVPERCHTRL